MEAHLAAILIEEELVFVADSIHPDHQRMVKSKTAKEQSKYMVQMLNVIGVRKHPTMGSRLACILSFDKVLDIMSNI